ncbi:hypothetical protein AB0945_01775 [Streptomyces sp. NPDC005474]
MRSPSGRIIRSSGGRLSSVTAPTTAAPTPVKKNSVSFSPEAPAY